MSLKAPYRFVPAGKHIVTPHWAPYISHDIPFSDGVSGHITFSIVAKSDLFISDGKDSANEKGELQFCSKKGADHDEPHYFIPATTLKGMTRNLVEILSFGKLKPRVANNAQKYGIRSLSHDEYLDEVAKDDLVAGLLTKQNDSYIFRHVKEGRINAHLAKNSRNAKRFSTQNDYLFKPSLNGPFTGQVVFTGRFPEKRKEYVFLDLLPSAEDLEVSQSIIDAFENAYSYTNNEANIPEKAQKKFAKTWQKLQNGTPIPVWATLEEGEIRHFGLSTNYRIESKIDVHQAIDNAQTPTEQPDLADCIFGYIADEKKKNTKASDFLKGRVFFKTAWLAGEAEFGPAITATLSTPTPSFYPAYLQDGATYLNEQAKISGWKRYPIKGGFKTHLGDNPKMNVTFQPMKEGASFQASIYFHNLRAVELGALLSALSLHGSMRDDNGVYYNIGMGKPLGLGKIVLSDLKLKTLYGQANQIKEYLKAFESYMAAFTNQQPKKWHESPSVTELCAMCQEDDDEKLKYMDLKKAGEAKRKGWRFRRYPKGKVTVESLITAEDLQKTKTWIQAEKSEQSQLPPLDAKQLEKLQEKIKNWLAQKNR